MLDVSGSMKCPLEFRGDSEECRRRRAVELAEASRAAAQKLCPLIGYDQDTRVSFWTFGDENSLTSHDASRKMMTPGEAILELDRFFDPDSAFDDNYTYINRSIYRLAVDHLLDEEDLEARGELKEIRGDASRFAIFVFTDDKEEPRDAVANQRYVDWVGRHERYLQLVKWVWGVYAQGAARDRRDQCHRADLNRASYTMHFGRPTTAAEFNPWDLPALSEISLRVPPSIRAIPSHDLACSEAPPPMVCSPGETSPFPAATQAGELKVPGIIENWGSFVDERVTEAWTIRAPGRNVEELEIYEYAACRSFHGRSISRDILWLRLDERQPALLPGQAETLEGGLYPVRFDRDTLCDELKRAYPNSTFYFQQEIGEPDAAEPGAGETIRRLGTVRVERRPVFTVKALSRRPQDPLRLATESRWKHYENLSAEYRVGMKVPPGAKARLKASVKVYPVAGDRRGPHPGQHAMVALQGIGGDGELFAEEGEGGYADIAFRLGIPRAPQVPWKSALGLGFSDPGDYEIVLTIEPSVSDAAGVPLTPSIRCDDCLDGFRHPPGGLLNLTIPLSIRPTPWSWWWIGLWTAILLSVLWVIWRWLTRPQFASGVTIGILDRDRDLRTAHNHGLKGKLAVFGRRPGFVDFRPGGGTIFLHNPLLQAGEQSTTGARNVVGVAPSKQGTQKMAVWCAAAASGPEGRTRIRVSGNYSHLNPTGHTGWPATNKDWVWIRYADLRYDSKTIEVLLEKDDGRIEILESYPISLLEDSRQA
jgi:hypothetical protein